MCLKFSNHDENFQTLKSYLDHSESGGVLPLRSKIPDMFSDSENYVRLLKIYREKSNTDLELFTKILSEISAQIGAVPPDEQVIRESSLKVMLY